MKHVLLVGGGQTHLEFLQQWKQHPVADTRLTLIHPTPQTIINVLAPSVVAGRFSTQQVQSNLPAMAQDAGAAWTKGSPTFFDPQARRLMLDSGDTLSFDAVSLDLPIKLRQDALAGAKGYALWAHPVPHFLKLWESTVGLVHERGGVHLVVIGGSPASIELALLAAQRLGPSSRITLVTGSPEWLAQFPAPIATVVQKALYAAKITVLMDRAVQVTETHVHFADGMHLSCDVPLVVDAPLQFLPDWLTNASIDHVNGKELSLLPSGQSVSHPHVWWAGSPVSLVGAQAQDWYAKQYARNLLRYLQAKPLQSLLTSSAPWSLDLGATQGVWHWGPFRLTGQRASMMMKQKELERLERYAWPLGHEATPD